ncbi:MAG: gas vesicle protein GvpN [Beijerinckiaceae bacterium]
MIADRRKPQSEKPAVQASVVQAVDLPPAQSLAEQIASDPKGSNVVTLRPRGDLFENDEILSIESRAISYLRAGTPVHLRGPAGTGKTTLALQIAAKLGRPAILVTGDGWLTAGNLVGRETATKTRAVVDRYVHSVRKTESETKAVWSDDVLTHAITGGFTLVYDEFTRSPPSANNPLLTALEERMLILQSGSSRDRYVKAHPDFRAIFTSNPEDYAGVNVPQDALIDRMITFDLTNHDRDTEVGIVAMRAGLTVEQCGPIVDIVRNVRSSGMVTQAPSLRSAIMIARIVGFETLDVSARSNAFVQLCFDVLESKALANQADPVKRQDFIRSLTAIITDACAAKPVKSRKPVEGTAAKEGAA